jgi:hypothetical protein
MRSGDQDRAAACAPPGDFPNNWDIDIDDE